MPPEPAIAAVSPAEVERSIRLSYVMAMLSAVYGASTGGMFLIGYALQLGASDVHIGLMSTIPMCCVVAQLLASVLVEKGVSRRRLTFLASLGNVLSWSLIILIPYAGGGLTPTARVAILIGVLTVVTTFGNLAANARGSWIGDLIPAESRGRFFGWLNTCAGIVGAFFAIAEGATLDRLKDHGIGAFSFLFGFGMLFGLMSAVLFLPQADVPLRRPTEPLSLRRWVGTALANRALVGVGLFATLWSLQVIAGPFYPAYMLRDLGMSFFSVGCVNAVVTATMLISSPFWGRVVDHYGCRPTLVAGVVMMVPLPWVWLWLDPEHVARVYWLLPMVNVLAGFAVAAVSVSLSTLIYKVTPAVGRSTQLAMYSIFVTLLAAPMPVLGGYLPRLLAWLGYGRDLRYTFYLASLAMAASAVAAYRISEPGCGRTRVLFRMLPIHLFRPQTLRTT